MNEDILNIISVVVTSIIVPMITYLGLKLSNYLKTKIKNEKDRFYLDQATNAVSRAVTAVKQIYVDDLKNNDCFTLEARKEAFNRAQMQALATMTNETKNAVAALYGDFNAWLIAEIETQVNYTKED